MTQGPSTMGTAPPLEREIVGPSAPDTNRASGTARFAYSQDYWDQVLSQLGRRRLSIAALLILIVMYSTAIYAPFLANDRPLYFHGIDLGTYRQAQREMPTAVSSLADRLSRVTSK